MDKKTKEKIRYQLQCLFNSCREGEYGIWEPNKEGFIAMAESLESIAKLMELPTLKEMYNPPSEVE